MSASSLQVRHMLVKLISVDCRIFLSWLLFSDRMCQACEERCCNIAVSAEGSCIPIRIVHKPHLALFDRVSTIACFSLFHRLFGRKIMPWDGHI